MGVVYKIFRRLRFLRTPLTAERRVRFRRKIVKLLILSFSFMLFVLSFRPSFSQDIKEPAVSGTFYPDDPQELSEMIDSFLERVPVIDINTDPFALISPHAGYSFSGQTAAYGYKLIKNKPYKTIIVIGTSHSYGLSGISVYPAGVFRTPLGDLQVDEEFAGKLLNKYENIVFEPLAFAKEHSVEVQLPFLQRALPQEGNAYRIVPVIMGACSLDMCRNFAWLLKQAIAERNDVLLIVSSDMAHKYDYPEVEEVDKWTLSYLRNMDAEGLYNGLIGGKLELCGGFGVVTTMFLAQELGYDSLNVLKYTNSAEVTGNRKKGVWTVGYASCVITDRDAANDEKGENQMLNSSQRKRLLEIARRSIETYLKTEKKMEVSEDDPALMKQMGAFVTLHQHGQLRGCIGNIIGQQPLYLTIRDMAIESATDDPRFTSVRIQELDNTDIEISVLSPLERVYSADQIQLGHHGVLVKKGFRSGVFLPQVAEETGWSKEEFLSNLCVHKAGIPADAWKDKSTEVYVFSAEVFSEKDVSSDE